VVREEVRKKIDRIFDIVFETFESEINPRNSERGIYYAMGVYFATMNFINQDENEYLEIAYEQLKTRLRNREEVAQ